jgi:AraC family transcriptional regulator
MLQPPGRPPANWAQESAFLHSNRPEQHRHSKALTPPITFIAPGRFELCCHDSPPPFRGTVQVCIPLEGAMYTVTRQSETGKTIRHRLGSRDILVSPTNQLVIDWLRPADIVSLQLFERFVRSTLGPERLRLSDSFTLRDHYVSATARAVRDMMSSGKAIAPSFAEAVATVIAHRVVIGDVGDSRLREVEPVSPLSVRQVTKIERFIDERLGQEIMLSELASLLDLSTWHFMRRFNASHGLSPHAFIVQRRLARATELLKEERLSITEISLEVGMSHSHFSRTFLKRFGVSPSEYRTRARRDV